MFLGMQDFDFAQILPKFAQILPKFAQKLVGDTATSPSPTALVVMLLNLFSVTKSATCRYAILHRLLLTICMRFIKMQLCYSTLLHKKKFAKCLSDRITIFSKESLK